MNPTDFDILGLKSHPALILLELDGSFAAKFSQ